LRTLFKSAMGHAVLVLLAPVMTGHVLAEPGAPSPSRVLINSFWIWSKPAAPLVVMNCLS
jgi:hypothetical protein